jgi:CMP-N,N'-diacetyllegionaminic acid synthase
MTTLRIIVPARGGSKRLPGKNLRTLGGAPLLKWTLLALRAAGIDQAPLLSTDDESIAEEGRRLGYAVPFLRPAGLGRDDTPTLDVVLHALDFLVGRGESEPDLVMLLQITSPFRSPALLTEGIARMMADPNADALIAVKPLHVGLSNVYGADGPYLSRVSSDRGPGYVPSGALYISRPRSLRENASFVPSRCLFLRHEGLETLDIDTEDDWTIAQAALAAGRISSPQWM